MKKVFVFLMLMWSAGFSQTRVPVFVSGEDGHRSYRIPSIISLQNGDLLAIAEGRVAGSADFGDINLVMKRSADKGKTWSELITLVDNDALQAGNPAPVVDLLDSRYPQGRIFLFYNTGNNHEGEVRPGSLVHHLDRQRSYLVATCEYHHTGAPTKPTCV